MKSPIARLERTCSICGSHGHKLVACDGGQVCEACSETTREGRDNTSRSLKAKLRRDQLQCDVLTGQREIHLSLEEQQYNLASGTLMSDDLDAMLPGIKLVSGGEAINQKHAGMVNTLTEPNVAALEASSHRTELLTQLGTDIAAMALDAADTISANNSLEKMLAHQMAGLHQASIRMLHRANLMQDTEHSVKYVNAAIKASTAYQGAMATLHRVRDDKRQHILVQHVNVGAGGQAVVGTVNSGGGQPS
jgi:hypothetical protein